MTRKQFVDYQEEGFWAYDVALGILLKHLLDEAEPYFAQSEEQWLADAIKWWRVVAVVNSYGLTIESTWSAAQKETFIKLIDQACDSLAQREEISAEEIESWPILEDERLFARGEAKIRTAPVIELGHAIIALIRGTLPTPPPDEVWLYGTPKGRDTLRHRH